MRQQINLYKDIYEKELLDQSLDDIIESLQQMKEEYKDYNNLRIEYEHEGGCCGERDYEYFFLKGDRMETDEEYEARLEKEEKQKQEAERMKKARDKILEKAKMQEKKKKELEEKELYEKLKKKYG